MVYFLNICKSAFSEFIFLLPQLGCMLLAFRINGVFEFEKGTGLEKTGRAAWTDGAFITLLLLSQFETIISILLSGFVSYN